MVVASGVAAVFASTQRVSQNDALSASHVSYPVGLSVVNDSSLLDDDAKWEYKRKSCNVSKCSWRVPASLRSKRGPTALIMPKPMVSILILRVLSCLKIYCHAQIPTTVSFELKQMKP